MGEKGRVGTSWEESGNIVTLSPVTGSYTRFRVGKHV